MARWASSCGTSSIQTLRKTSNILPTVSVSDKWDLNGNGSTEDKLGLPYGVLDIKAPTDVSAQSAAKMATQPETRYVTYDGVKKAVIGAESNVDYRLVATNPYNRER